MADIVKLNYYVAAELDQANVPKLRPIRDRYLNVETPPASTFLVVARLSRPGWLIEIDAVAAIEEVGGLWHAADHRTVTGARSERILSSDRAKRAPSTPTILTGLHGRARMRGTLSRS